MTMANLAPLMSSDKPDWHTPQNVLDLVREVFGSPIGLDPCTSADNPTAALRFFTEADDGLARPWESRLGIFVNPPYGRGIDRWTWKMGDIGRPVGGPAVIGLIPARTDTKYWHRDVITADAICFWRGRLRFVGAPASAPFPSALPYWGPHVNDFEQVFGRVGWVIRP